MAKTVNERNKWGKGEPSLTIMCAELTIFIRTEGAFRRPMTYDSSQSHTFHPQSLFNHPNRPLIFDLLPYMIIDLKRSIDLR